jgi:hypothetical protein
MKKSRSLSWVYQPHFSTELSTEKSGAKAPQINRLNKNQPREGKVIHKFYPCG